MSDKNRNMNDINDQKTAEQQAFSEEIRRRLAEPGSGKPTLDEFKVMVYKDREKRRKKRNALVACIVAAFIVGYLTYDDLVPEVGADKNPKETIQTEDGVIVEDGGWGSSEEEDNVFIIEEWENIEDAKLIAPKILIPNYVPEGYSFKKLQVETLANNDCICEFVFNKNNDTIELEVIIQNSNTSRLEISGKTKELVYSEGKIYIQETQGNEKRIATTQFVDGMIVCIVSTLSDEELISIVTSLYN